MPIIAKLLTVEELKRAAPVSQQDLSEYISLLKQVADSGNAGADLSLGTGEDQRTEKRRLTLAAKAIDKVVVWRKAPKGTMRFVLTSKGEQAPGARAKRGSKSKKGTPVADAAS